MASRYKGVAALLKKRHDRMVNKYLYRSDKEGSKLFHFHLRASQRFDRVAQGKHPFKEHG